MADEAQRPGAAATAEPKPKIRILVLDDHEVVRHGVVSMIAFNDDMEVVAQAGTGQEALALYAQHKPDVSIVDLRLPDMGGSAFVTKAREIFAGGNFVILTTWDSDEDIYEAFKAGAGAYLLKDSFSAEILSTIRWVHGGLRIMPQEIAGRLEERANSRSLSPREREVVALAARGDSNKLIGAALGITEGTVKIYMKRIFEKLNVDSRTGAVTEAINRGIIKM